MKKNIAIITGGDSSELVISLKSAEQVSLHIDKEKFNTHIVYIREDDWHVRLDPEGRNTVPLDRGGFSFEKDGERTRFDYAFIAMHGPPGEDGQLQAYLDSLGIPYSTSGARSLELSFNKHSCKEIVSREGILTAEYVLVRRAGPASAENGSGTGKESFGISTEGTPGPTMFCRGRTSACHPEELIDLLGLPCFVKPNAGGSSFGVSRINHAAQLKEAIDNALEEGDEVLVETFIPGNELTCGVLKTGSGEFIFPVTEIISKNEFFDYEAKYTEGMADEVTPANIPAELAQKCQELSSRIYDLLDCRGIVRIDFINREGDLYFLELNGVPGMSRESIIPKQIRTMGYTESGIYNLVIEETAGW
jgi:D-alanine-D-alanine ligase